MSLKLKYLLNTGIVAISKVFESIFAYLIIVLITRNLGAEGLGQYSFIFSFVGLFFILGDFGVLDMIIKDLSRDFSKVDKYVSNVLIIRIFLGLLFLSIYFISLLFISRDYMFALFLAGIINFFTLIGSVFDAILRVKSKGYLVSLMSFSERFLALIGAGIVFYFTKNISLFVLVLAIAQFIKMAIGFLVSKQYFKMIFNVDFKLIKKLIKLGYPFMFICIFTLVYVQLDTVMLSFMKGDLVVGFYQTGYKLINILNLIPIIILMFGFPLMSKLFVSNKKALSNFFEKMLFYSFSFMLPVIVGVWFIGDRILKFVYDISSIESFIAFKILIIAELFVFLTVIMGQTISATDGQKVFMKIAGSGALLNIVLNFFLIPKYSLYGAGIATLITYFIMFVIMLRFINKNLFSFNFFRKLWLPIIASLIMGYVLSLILSWHIIFIILIGGGVYGLFFIWEIWTDLK